MTVLRPWALGACLWAALHGCESDDSTAGVERGPCYPNDTCNAGLECLSGLCVDSEGRGPDGSQPGPADASGGSASMQGDMDSSSGAPAGDAMTSSGDASVDVPVLDGDGPWIAFLRDLRLHLIRADGTGLQRVPMPPSDPGASPAPAWSVFPCPEWSPDGTKLALVERRGLVVFDVTDGSASVLSDVPWNPRPRWSPDGRTLVVPSPERTLHALDATTGSTTVLFANAAGHDVAPDGTLYFVREQIDAAGDELASLHRLPSFDVSEDLVEPLPLARADLLEVEAHPDGSPLLIMATQVWEDERLALGLVQYSPSTGEERRFGEPQDAAPSYFPDGSALVLARTFPGRNRYDIVVTDLDGRLITRLTDDEEVNDVCPVVRPGDW